MRRIAYVALHQRRISARRMVLTAKELKGFPMTIKSIAAKFNAWRRYRTSVRELSQLTDRELRDLGLTRAEIESVARKSVGI